MFHLVDLVSIPTTAYDFLRKKTRNLKKCGPETKKNLKLNLTLYKNKVSIKKGFNEKENFLESK